MEKRTQGLATILHLGLADHGRVLSGEEFEAAQYDEGFHYELIGGKLYVSPAANMPHNALLKWLEKELDRYATAHPEIVNFVSNHPRVFVPGHDELTTPEPDLAAYRDYPFHIPWHQRDWRSTSPVLVAEIVSEDDPDKDLVRNVNLYQHVSSIREYWILDPRDVEQPALLVYRRRGGSWQRVIPVTLGETYTTRWLPGLKLVFDLSKV